MAYCGSIDAKIRASDKDLPVILSLEISNFILILMAESETFFFKYIKCHFWKSRDLKLQSKDSCYKYMFQKGAKNHLKFQQDQVSTKLVLNISVWIVIA